MAYKAPQAIPQDKLDALAAYNKNKKDKKAVDNSTKGGYTYTDEDKGIMKEPGGYEHTQEEWDDIRDRSSSTKPTTLKNERYKPEPKKQSKPMKEGDYGTVDSEKNSEAMGPNMGKVIKESAADKEPDLQEKARRSLGFKKGGMTRSSASKRADGIAQRGKTRGKIC